MNKQIKYRYKIKQSIKLLLDHDYIGATNIDGIILADVPMWEQNDDIVLSALKQNMCAIYHVRSDLLSDRVCDLIIKNPRLFNVISKYI